MQAPRLIRRKQCANQTDLTHKRHCFKAFLCNPACPQSIERYTNAKMRAFYSPRQNGSSPIFSADGNKLLTDKEDIFLRWAKDFSTALNCTSTLAPKPVHAWNKSQYIIYSLNLSGSMK
ncbi:hypothetical protein BgiMline_025906 [Biomphalaria glabrata]|nr:hypothetical protein BgiMline_021932 [Biomphalaria glabrata]KAI8778376.1 hypothetical protein BgiBS90_021026 [Biomphalaria glabrata]